MTAKILVADDSLTIQKVVSITLANNPYEITECLNEERLLEEVKSSKYELVLLDYNLSNSKSGNDLAREIKKHSPETSIMIMLGTFDSVDESTLKEAGIDDKIVKPFESSKFIQKCQSLIDKASSGHVAIAADPFTEAPVETEEKSFEDDLDNWQVEAQNVETEIEIIEEDEFVEGQNSFDQPTPSKLSDELSGWGMQIPVIGKKESLESLLPPKIGTTPSLSIVKEDKNEDEVIVPNSDDLEYPDMFDSSDSINIEDMGLSSKLVPVNELAADTDNSQNYDDDDSTDPGFQIEEVAGPTANLEAELSSEMNPDDFWAADESLSSDPHVGESFGGAGANPQIAGEVDRIAELEDFDSNLDLEIDIPKAAPAAKAPAQTMETPKFDQDEIVRQIQASIKPMIEELVKEFCKERIEQVAWEVIPDLAENLIRKEITDISKRL
jgi:DNA-binding response OmpR family regulator